MADYCRAGIKSLRGTATDSDTYNQQTALKTDTVTDSEQTTLTGDTRVSSKQTKINFGSNRNKPKQDLFCVCFGLFHETKNKTFRFVSVFRTYIETTETNRSVSHQTETNRNNPKFSVKYPNILSFKLFGCVFCFKTNRKKRQNKKI